MITSQGSKIQLIVKWSKHKKQGVLFYCTDLIQRDFFLKELKFWNFSLVRCTYVSYSFVSVSFCFEFYRLVSSFCFCFGFYLVPSLSWIRRIITTPKFVTVLRRSAWWRFVVCAYFWSPFDRIIFPRGSLSVAVFVSALLTTVAVGVHASFAVSSESLLDSAVRRFFCFSGDFVVVLAARLAGACFSLCALGLSAPVVRPSVT